MEKLGLGPKQCMRKNANLVYGRMTGFGQDGPLADTVGHDTNYISLVGALHAIGSKDQAPPIPLNLIGDLGGGGIFLAMGMLAAMLEASKSGEGQIVDAAMVDGVASMMTMFYGLMAGGMWADQRQSNLLDGAAPFVNVYETSDNKYVSVCAIEKRFYKALLQALDVSEIDPDDQYRRESWPEHKKTLARILKSKTRDEWRAIFEGTDACATPVLSLTEAPHHAHNQARKTFVEVDGIQQPAPAPRFSRTISDIQVPPNESGENDREALAEWGLSDAEIQRLYETGTLG
jgi:alpha-methylacyl-CoA racemase